MNKWTDDEKDFVLDEYKSGKNIEDIFNMKKIKRSKYAIECKIYSYIYDLLQNGKSHSHVAKELNRTKDEIKEIEQKMFEIKNQTDVKTMYTGNGGYKYGENNTAVDLGNFHHLNRTMNTLLSYYENIERLNKLRLSNTIESDFYAQIMVKLNEFTFDKQKIIESLDINNMETNKSANISVEFEKLPNHNLDHHNSDHHNSNHNSNHNTVTDDKPKKKDKINTDSDGDFIKKITKRLI